MQERLENGLRVLVTPLESRGVVDVRVEVHVGTWTEGGTEGAGLCHLFEHLLVGGTTSTRSAEESARMLKALGAQFRAQTDVDRTWFEIQVAPDGLDVALELLSDWIRNCAVDESELERERGVIRAELLQNRDDPMRRAWEGMLRMAYRRHPARLPVAGDLERIESVTRDELLRFKAERFVPGNCALAITGDVDAAEAVDLAVRHFGEWKGPLPPPIPVFDPEPQTSPRRVEVEGPGEDASIVIGYRACAQVHPDAPAMDVIQYLLSSGQGGLLYREIVEERALASFVRVTSWNPAPGGGVLAIMATCADDKRDEIVGAICAVVEALGAGSIDPDEFERARAQLVADTAFRHEAVSALGHRIASDALTTGSPAYVERYVHRLLEMTLDDVTQAAGRYLIETGRTVSIVRPRGSVPPAPARASDPVADRREVALDGGAVLRVERRPGSAVAGVYAAFRAGTLFESEGAHGATAALRASMQPGPRAQEIERELERRGASLRVVSDDASLALEARALASDLPSMLSWVAARAADPGLERVDLEARVGGVVERELRTRRVYYAVEATDRLREVLYAGGPLAQPPTGDEAALSALDRETVERFAAETLCRANLSLAVVGDVDPDEVVRLATEALAGLPEGERRPLAPVGPARDHGDPVVFRTTRERAVLAIGFDGAAVEDNEERVALDILDAYVSGRRVPSGPLHRALRVERDLAYYASAANVPFPGGGFFQVVVECDPARFEEALQAVRGVLQEVATGPLDDDSLAGARRELLLSRALADQTAVSRARMLSLGAIYGLPVDQIERYREAVLSLGKERVREAAARVFGKPGRLIRIWPEGVKDP